MKKAFSFFKSSDKSQLMNYIINCRVFNAISTSTMAMVPLLLVCGVLELVSSVSYASGFTGLYSWLELLKDGLAKITPFMLNIFLSVYFASRNRMSPMSLVLINLGVLVIVSSFMSNSPYFFLDINIPESMFLGVVTGMACEKVINLFHGYKHKNHFEWGFSSAIILVLVALCLCVAVNKTWTHEIHYLINIITRSLYPSDFLHGLIYLVFCGASWFFGLNGENLLEAQLRTLTLISSNNMTAWHAGHASLNIISNIFFSVWCNIGGSGSTLSLAIAMFFRHQKFHRRILNISAPLLLFNTNETLIFGVPIVFNPIMIIPFILVPIINFTTAYVATISGMITPLQNQVSWVTPPLMDAWVASGGSIRTIILQIILIILGAKVYYFFLKMMENRVNFNDKRLQSVNENLFAQDETINQPNELHLVRNNDYLSEMNEHFIAQDKINFLRKSGDFVLYFQPQMKLPENKSIGFEALIRHEGRDGVITPPIFLKYYERLNLMPEIDLWVLQSVVSTIRMQLSEFSGYTMSINMSPQTLSDTRLIPILKKCLTEPLPNGWALEFEITESQKINNPKSIAKCLVEIKKMGVKIALDDFGSGYSSISYLNEYDLDKIKIDRSLVQNLNKENGFDFLKNVVTLCQGTNALVLIEGVETESEKAMIYSAGVSYAQGYLFNRPLPFKSLYAFLDNERR